MRYLTESFALGALRRGRPVEQFLGPVGSRARPGIRYLEVRPTKTTFEVFLHTLEDVGTEMFFDLVEFPPLNPDDEEEERGRLIASADDALDALTAAETSTGAVRGRWVNESVAQDEYRDFVRAGRPTDASPEGHPWPAPQAGR
ncbi:hypothetical protein ABT150_13865 [Streptomyces mirabilis]|uniref:hypothetical protein n=1 Tax=Streptomyces mirabilis TaxID=68239 RepID=UPI0033282634